MAAVRAAARRVRLGARLSGAYARVGAALGARRRALPAGLAGARPLGVRAVLSDALAQRAARPPVSLAALAHYQQPVRPAAHRVRGTQLRAERRVLHRARLRRAARVRVPLVRPARAARLRLARRDGAHRLLALVLLVDLVVCATATRLARRQGAARAAAARRRVRRAAKRVRSPRAAARAGVRTQRARLSALHSRGFAARLLLQFPLLIIQPSRINMYSYPYIIDPFKHFNNYTRTLYRIIL